MQLEQLLKRYFSFRELRQGTQLHYQMTVNSFFEWLGRPGTVADFSDDTVNAFLRGQLSIWSPATVKSKRTDLIALWQFAFRSNFTDIAPRNVLRPRVALPIPTAYTPEEMQRLMASAKSLAGALPNGVEHRQYWPAFISLVYDTALRLSDVLTLRKSQLHGTTITLVAQKTSRRHRCSIRPETLELLRLADDGGEYLLPWPLSMSQFRYWWKQILVVAELPTGRKEGPQKLRRTSATELARACGIEEARNHLGHSVNSVGLAERHYLGIRAYPESSLPPAIFQS